MHFLEKVRKNVCFAHPSKGLFQIEKLVISFLHTFFKSAKPAKTALSAETGCNTR